MKTVRVGSPGEPKVILKPQGWESERRDTGEDVGGEVENSRKRKLGG